MTDSRKIVAVRIVPPQSFGDDAKVFARFEGDVNESKLLGYFADEISFTEAELIGKTRAEVSALYHAKDVAYLQSYR